LGQPELSDDALVAADESIIEFRVHQLVFVRVGALALAMRSVMVEGAAPDPQRNWVVWQITTRF
jgi:hypothetical protein